MFGMKLKWYPLFESESELENLFAVKKNGRPQKHFWRSSIG